MRTEQARVEMRPKGKTLPPERKEGEVNICGVLVHIRPEQMEAGRKALTEIPGVEIHGEADDGRLILTVEDTPGTWAGESMTQIHNVKGVLSASLIYHHCERNDVQEEV